MLNAPAPSQHLIEDPVEYRVMRNTVNHLTSLTIWGLFIFGLTCYGNAAVPIPERLRELINSKQADMMVSGADANELVTELEEIIIGNRLAIERWHATVTISSLTGAEGDKDQIMRVDSYADGDKLRRDYFYRNPIENRSDDSMYVSISSSNGSREYEYSEAPDPRGLKFSLVFRGVAKLRRPPSIKNTIQFDPRAIGNFPNGALSPAHGPEGTIKLNSYTIVSISRENLYDETPCLKVIKHDSMGNAMTYWSSIGEGFSIRRYLFDASNSIDPTNLEQTDTEVKRWKDSQFWVPVSTKYRQTYSEELQVDETAQITWHSINEPIEPDLFEPVTFSGLKSGTRVFDVHEMLGPKRPRIWDGQKIVEEKTLATQK